MRWLRGGVYAAAGVAAACVAAPAAPHGPAHAPDLRLPGQAMAAEAPPGAVLRLSLRGAIDRAERHDLQTLLARERRKAQGARTRQALAALLPSLSGNVSQSRRTINLRSEGIDIPGAPSVVGPFDTFDARAQLVQNVFDLSAVRTYQAARVQAKIAALQQDLARQQVASGAALDYVAAQRRRDAIRAARANLRQARRLLKLAEDKKKAGVATGVDVVRARTTVAQRRNALIQARTRADGASLRLKRATGVSLGRKIILTDSLPATAAPPPGVEAALRAAFNNRDELLIDKRSVTEAGYERRAARDSLLPSVALSGGYGLSGATPRRSDETTYSYGLRIRIPLFSGGRHRARVDVAESRRRQALIRLRDLRQKVEKDVRLALKRLASARQRLSAARATRELAKRELRLARDRFAKGAADNIEVVDAQAALAGARTEFVAALAAYNTGRVNLAAALGKSDSFNF